MQGLADMDRKTPHLAPALNLDHSTGPRRFHTSSVDYTTVSLLPLPTSASLNPLLVLIPRPPLNSLYAHLGISRLVSMEHRLG